MFVILYLAVGLLFESLLYSEFEERGVLEFLEGWLAWPVRLTRWYIGFFGGE